MGGVENIVMLRPADTRGGLEPMNFTIGACMRPRHVRQRSNRPAQIADVPWRRAADLVAANGVDIWLVDGTPEVAEAAELLDRLRRIAREERDRVGREEGAALLEPDRVREVV